MMVYGESEGLLSCQINVTLCLMKSDLWEEDINEEMGVAYLHWSFALRFMASKSIVFPDSPF